MCAVLYQIVDSEPLLLCLGHHAQLSILKGDQFALIALKMSRKIEFRQNH